MNELDPQSIVPLYKQLKDLLLQEIKEGIYKANQKIPTELELSGKRNICAGRKDDRGSFKPK